MTYQRLGEQNGRSRLSDAQVEELRSLREEEIVIPGKRRLWTYARLASRFAISKRYAIMVCNFEYRHGVPDEWPEMVGVPESVVHKIAPVAVVCPNVEMVVPRGFGPRNAKKLAAKRRTRP